MSAAAASKPLTLQSSTVLSQDVITSASILVESTSPAPVAAFTNPVSSEVEALAIVNKQVCHVTRDRQTDSGWRSVPLFSGRAAGQVVAGVAFQANAYLFFIEGASAGQLYASQLGADGKTWSTPVAVSGALTSHPRVAYTPNGALIVYGMSQTGDLVTARQTGMNDPFTAVVHPVQGALAGDDFQLCMMDEAAFTILVNAGGKAYTITGDIGHANIVGPTLAPQVTQQVKYVALGYCSPAGLSTTAMFLLVTEDESHSSGAALHCWSQVAAQQPVVQKVANRSISLATGHVGADGSLHVYAIDNELGLWVLHQSARQPWREDGTPNWVPFLPIDKGIGHVVSDMNPAAAPSLFAIDGGDYSLRLHTQDAVSRMWKSQQILQHKAEVYQVTRHRAEVRILDANARALPNHAVTVQVEKDRSAVEIWAGGRLHLIDQKGTTLTTDMNGKLTVAIMATENGLACPNLVVSCDGLASPQTVRPAGGLHEYLSGQGTLNPTNPPDRGGGPLPQFEASGNTLKAAKVNGKPLAPGASDSKTATDVATAIQHGADVALGKKDTGVYGFAGSLVKGDTSFQTFDTPQAFSAHCDAHHLAAADLDSFWDELRHFFADIFEGIKNAVIKIIKFAVRVVEAVVQFTLDIAEFVGKTLHLDISGIEKAASFMHGFFNSVEAGIDKVVAWLEALFDFGAIWRTKMAIQKGVEDFCPYIVQLAGEAQTIADGWFAQQKQTVNDHFDDMIKNYKGQTFGGQSNWQNPAAPASRTPFAGAGQAAPSDFSDNPHHNWLHDKAIAYSPDTSGLTLDGPVDALWEDVARHFVESAKEFQKFRAALDKFQSDIWATLKDPASFARMLIPDLIEMVRELALATLDLLDAIADAIAAFLGSCVKSIDEAFRTELPLGFLNTLWKWMAEAAGYPHDEKLNLYSLSALLAALPATLIYKLAIGVDHEPFPEGKMHPQLTDAAAAQLGAKMPWQSVLTSDIVRMLQVVPAGAADFLAVDSPGWLTGVNFGFGGTIWVLRHGYPAAWEEILIATAVSGPVLLRFAPSVYAWWTGLHRHDSNDIVALVSTAYGVGALIYGIVIDVKYPKQKLGQKIANILMPLPSLFAFLTLTPLRMNVEFAPIAIAGNLLFDTVGYVGGGAELMIDTLQWKDKSASLAG